MGVEMVFKSTAKILEAKPSDSNLLGLSVSKVKTFKDCKAKYKFTYIDKLPRKEWDFHVFGKFLHDVLEKYHLARLAGDARSNDIVMADALQSGTSVYKEKLSASQEAECREIINQYLLRLNSEETANEAPQVLAVEKDFNIDIDGRILLNGFIDKVQTDHDGIMHVADYKTTKNKKYIKNDFMQLKTYAYVMCLEDPSIERVRTSYIMLRHNCESIISEFSRKEIMKMEQVFLDYADQIGVEKLWRPNTTPLCEYCDHLETCSSGRNFINDKKGFGKFGATDW
jgi:CRISPR/Cas system-associated exonuclease Cas4 (RecB family)